MSDEETTLQAMAQQVEVWQKSQRPALTDAAMIRRFPALGSSKTYSHLRRGIFQGFNIESQTENYRSVLNQIEEIGTQAKEAEIYEDFQNVQKSSSTLIRLMQQSGQNRLYILEGPTGSGKTAIKKVIAAKYPGKVVTVDASMTWSSLTSALTDICKALGVRQEKMRRDKGILKDAALAELNRSNRILWIDESHHMTGDVLNLLKTFINESESVFVISGIDTLWQKLTVRYYEEAKQLLQNRLFDRYTIKAPTPKEAEAFLSRRCPELNGAASEASVRVAGYAKDHGRFGFLTALSERIQREGGEPDGRSIIEMAETLAEGVKR